MGVHGDHPFAVQLRALAHLVGDEGGIAVHHGVVDREQPGGVVARLVLLVVRQQLLVGHVHRHGVEEHEAPALAAIAQIEEPLVVGHQIFEAAHDASPQVGEVGRAVEREQQVVDRPPSRVAQLHHALTRLLCRTALSH